MTLPANRRPVSIGRSDARRDQLVALCVSVVCLALIFAIQPSITRLRVGAPDAAGNRTGGLVVENNGTVAQLAIEAPRLTVGGFRGLLAMYLWQGAEDDKNERRWQALDTKYNMIGKLEPYFTSVYIFNAWNLAYNLSAQWHDVPNKYLWVLKGLDHLYLGEKYNPENSDMIAEQAQMYFNKIGDSFERLDYRRYWRDNIRDQYQIPARKEGEAFDPFEPHRMVALYLAMPQFKISLLEDPQNPAKKGYGIKILAAGKNAPPPSALDHNYYGLRHISPEDADKLEAMQWSAEPKKGTPEWNAYLKQLDTAFASQQAREKPDATIDFRYGISVYYFAYVEYARCLCQPVSPSTTGRQVIDARPAMSFRMWVRDDAYYAMSRIREIFMATPRGAEIKDYDDRVLDIRDCYRNIRLIAQPNALEEFELHLSAAEGRYPQNENIHRKHIYETNYMAAIARGESEMFEGLVAWRGPEAKPKLTAEAQRRLLNAINLYKAAQHQVDYYLERFYPIKDTPQGRYVPPDRGDYEKFKDRLQTRIDGVQAFLDAPDEASRKTDFLEVDTIEK